MSTAGAGGVNGPREWDAPRVEAALDALEGWGPVVLLASTGSTNADVADAARAGAAEGFILVADEQIAGRGRLGRGWSSPPGAGIAVSVLLRPALAPELTGWLPLLVGVTVAEALRVHGVPAALKWPNDVVVPGPTRDGGPGPRKLGGLLAERVAEEGAVVVGIGLNVALGDDELPVPTATSTRLEGAVVDREDLLVAILTGLRSRYHAWQAVGGDAQRCGLATDYRALCVTLGAQVKAHLPDGTTVEARATQVDDSGRLVLEVPGAGRLVLAAGDVEHLR